MRELPIHVEIRQSSYVSNFQMISVLIATFSITDDSSIKKRRRPCRQKIHNIITYAQLGIHFTWTNDAVNPFKCIICSVSTKFATYPSESAPLLHIRVPSKKCKLFSTRLTKTFFFISGGHHVPELH